MFLSAGITAFYMFRLVYMTFFGEARDQHKYEHAHESPKVMTIPLTVLAIFSVGTIWWGWYEHLVAKPELAAYATVAAAVEPAHEASHDVAHSAHNIAMILSILLAGLGILVSTATYYWKKISAEAWGNRLRPVYNLLWNKYYFDEMYNATAVAGTLLVSRVSGWFDLRIIDGVVNGVARWTAKVSFAGGWHDLRIVDGLVNLVGRMIQFFGAQLREIQTGRVQSYILMALFVVVLISIIQLL
jgi:NADH-quinone oxidoreductase subunit L